MADKPKYRVVAKSKTTGNFVNVFAFWENEKGISGTLDRDVAKIVLADGKTLAAENVWFNLYIESDEHDQTSRHEDKEQTQTTDNEQDVPF